MNPIITKMKPLRVNTMRDEQQIAIKALDSIGAVVYASEVAGSFYARGYLRNGRNPKFNYRFSTDARRTEYVTTWASDLEAREASKLAARAAKKTSKHSLVVGDILNTSWGYDQTNVEFYQVVGLKAKTMVMLRPIASIQHDESHVLPARDSFTGEAFSKRVNAQYNVVKISSCQRAYPTDTAPLSEGTYGYRPSYETPWGQGH